MLSTRKRSLAVCVLAAGLLAAGCSDDTSELCKVGTVEGCENGLVCEEVPGGTPTCFAPIHITGRVFDAATTKGIPEATVAALDPNGGARSTVVRSGPDGAYTLPIAVPRDAAGKPRAEQVTLRVAALGYQPFPTAPRTALPIAINEAAPNADNTKPWVVKSAATDVALIGLPGGAAGLGAISGRVSVEGLKDVSAGGVLVVGDVAGKAVSTAVTDTAGAFVLFNVPAGDIALSGYRSGLRVVPATIKMAGALVKDVVLQGAVDQLAPVTGSVNIVNADGGSKTSVLLVVESTFDDKVARGEAPAGLRVGDVSGQFKFENVPPGKYVVLAAFENDGLVRDPDTSIGGTAIVHIEVKGAPVDTGASFKVTGALAIISPGATALEVLPPGDPVMKWKDDSSEDGYELRVYNAFGDMVHENKDLPKVTGADVTYTWTGAQLQKGMIYQFRVVSFHVEKTGTGRTYIAATEDLRGVFMAP